MSIQGNFVGGILPTAEQVGAAPAAIMELVKAFGINTGNILDVPNSNFNTLTGNSIYKGLKGSAQGFPDQMGEWAFVLTLHYDDASQFGVQFAWDMNGYIVCNRYKRNGTWNDWSLPNANAFAPVDFVLANASRYQINDALNINLTDPYGTENKMGYVMSGVTSQMPSGLSHGIREVFYINLEWVIIKITGWDSYSYSPCVVYNQYRGSSKGWTGWEWENPPLQSGVEYRTTMRRRGQPDYVKLIDFGSLPASGVASVYVGIAGTRICYINATAFSNTNGESQPFPMFQNGEPAAYYWVDNSGNLNVNAVKNVSDNYSVFEIYYTKS